MDKINIILIIITVIQLGIIIYLLFFRIKKIEWNQIKFNENKKLYTFDFLSECGTPIEVVNHLICKVEIASFFENNNAISLETLTTYAKNKNFQTDVNLIEKKINQHLNQNTNESVDIKAIIEIIYYKSTLLLQKINNIDNLNEEKIEAILLETFKIFFIYLDLIDYLQNTSSWVNKKHLVGLKYLLDNNIEMETYSGSQNLLEYDKSILTIYQILKKYNSITTDNLFLGYKII